MKGKYEKAAMAYLKSPFRHSHGEFGSTRSLYRDSWYLLRFGTSEGRCRYSSGLVKRISQLSTYKSVNWNVYARNVLHMDKGGSLSSLKLHAF
jgi:tRNA(Glu) U13 pseudouridine synthase TruD